MEEGTQRVYLQDIKTSSEVPRNEANETKRILKKETERKHNRFDNTIRQKEIFFPTQKQQACHQIECLRTCLWQRTKKTSQETRKIFRIAKKHASHQSAREKELENAGEIWTFDERGETIVCAEGGGEKCKEEKNGDCKADVHDLSGKLE
jgi:hypothetical protein